MIKIHQLTNLNTMIICVVDIYTFLYYVPTFFEVRVDNNLIESIYASFKVIIASIR